LRMILRALRLFWAFIFAALRDRITGAGKVSFAS